MIDVEQRSTVSASSKEEINKNLFRRRLSKTGEPLDEIAPNFDDSQSVIEQLSKGLEDDE